MQVVKFDRGGPEATRKVNALSGKLLEHIVALAEAGNAEVAGMTVAEVMSALGLAYVTYANMVTSVEAGSRLVQELWKLVDAAAARDAAKNLD